MVVELPGQDIVLTPKTENRLFFCGWKIWAGISVGWEWNILHWKVDSQTEVESVCTESDYISESTIERQISYLMKLTNRNLRRKIVMALFLLITYIVIFTFQIILFVITIRKKTKKLWRILFSSELIPLLISIGLMIYFNNLPGYGFMPGLTYLGEILFSFGAVVLYCISFLISICSYIAISYKQRKRWINRFCRLFTVLSVTYFRALLKTAKRMLSINQLFPNLIWGIPLVCLFEFLEWA